MAQCLGVITTCGDLNENVPRRLIQLNKLSPVGGDGWGGLGCVPC